MKARMVFKLLQEKPAEEQVTSADDQLHRLPTTDTLALGDAPKDSVCSHG